MGHLLWFTSMGPAWVGVSRLAGPSPFGGAGGPWPPGGSETDACRASSRALGPGLEAHPCLHTPIPCKWLSAGERRVLDYTCTSDTREPHG
jgi:hypothetical protein